MANTFYEDVAKSLTPQPLKGFIELAADERRALVSISTIVAVIDRAEEGCLLIVREHVVGLSGQGGMAYVKNSYEEIMNKLTQAQ